MHLDLIRCLGGILLKGRSLDSTTSSLVIIVRKVILSLSLAEMASVIELFDFQEESTVCDKSSFDIKSHKTNGFYFPQFQQIFYLKPTKDMLREQTLSSFVRMLIQVNIEKFQGLIDDPYRQELIFDQLISDPSFLNGNIQMEWNQCNRVIVRFRRCLAPSIVRNTKQLVFNTDQASICLVQYDIFKKFQVRDIYTLKKLGNYRFTALKAGKQILKHYDTLEKIEAVSETNEVCPLFTSQVFYHQMQQAYARRKEFLNELVLDFLEMREVQPIILQGTTFSISNQKQFVLDYFHGSIEHLCQDERALLTSVVLYNLEKLPYTQAESLYFLEDFDQSSLNETFRQEQIVRIEVFCHATTSPNQQALRKDKKYHIYQILPLTARYIGNHIISQNDYDHIILPFNDYLVEDIRRQGQKNFIRLRELPTPKYLETHLVIWISDRLNEARQFQQRSVILDNQNNQEVMIVRNNRIYQAWLRRYYPVIALRKMCVVFQGKIISEGLQALSLTKNHLGPESRIVFYTEHPRSFAEQLSARMERDDKIRVTSNYRSVLNFIVSSFKPKSVDCDCEECECTIF